MDVLRAISGLVVRTALFFALAASVVAGVTLTGERGSDIYMALPLLTFVGCAGVWAWLRGKVGSD